MPASTDRGDVVHLAGFRRLSPAVREGGPALVGAGDPAGRCGWADFFAALAARRLAVAWTDDGAGPVRLVPRREARRDPVHRPSLSRALAQARAFVAAGRGA